MLSRKNITVTIEENNVLKDISLSFEKGKNYCILGKNGSGKSSLALTTMGHPSYEITQWDITIDGESIKDMTPDERAKFGIFLAFQSIPEIKGIKLFEFLRSIYSAKTGTNQSFIQFKKTVIPLLDELHIDHEFLRRDLNVGFSGWERRKIEILQLKLLEPTYIFLDEVDSGLDVDAFKAVAELIKSLNNQNNSFIIITHYFSILDYLPIDIVYVLESGKLIKEWLQDIAEKVRDKWFSWLE
jgi:Fe-S cluster assembly ATP-binding protein